MTPRRRFLNVVGSILYAEFIFALFLYSNHIKFIFHSYLDIPGDETAIFFLGSLLPVLWILYRRGIPVQGLAVFVAGAVFFAYVLLTQLWSPSRTLARRETFLLLTGGLWSLLVGALLLAAERERVLRFLKGTALIGAGVAVYGWILRLRYGDFFLASTWREMGFGSLYQLLGQMTALGGVTSLAFAVFAAPGSRRQFFWLLAATLSLALSLASGSRLSAVGAIVGVFVLALCLPVRIGRGRFQLSTGHLVLMGGFFLLFLALIYAETVGISLKSIDRFQKYLAESESNEGLLQRFDRPNYLSIAWNLWISAPLLGVGFMGFSPMGFMSEIPGTHPHNVFAQILAETGLVGATLFLMFLYCSYRHFSWKRLHTDPLFGMVIAASAIPWSIALFSGSLGTLWQLYAFVPLATLPPPEGTPRVTSATGGIRARERLRVVH